MKICFSFHNFLRKTLNLKISDMHLFSNWFLTKSFNKAMKINFSPVSNASTLCFKITEISYEDQLFHFSKVLPIWEANINKASYLFPTSWELAREHALDRVSSELFPGYQYGQSKKYIRGDHIMHPIYRVVVLSRGQVVGHAQERFDHDHCGWELTHF